ncbi:membrane protein UL56 [Equid alphaherpesvirus 3]|uniref:Membrane protein UL56 n=1 Tax=Equid alphaherpesvirus 3 TaxID=80341 RepID=A0A077BCH3_9ALPH|nr:membrane protein UL56 [Equid alphaherpesvirus 3]AIL02918.1 membrane protein UL56 [Equid alphaherpesvirus 3]
MATAGVRSSAILETAPRRASFSAAMPLVAATARQPLRRPASERQLQLGDIGDASGPLAALGLPHTRLRESALEVFERFMARLPSRPPSYSEIDPEAVLERGVERPRAWSASLRVPPPSYLEAMRLAPPAYEVVSELSPLRGDEVEPRAQCPNPYTTYDGTDATLWVSGYPHPNGCFVFTMVFGAMLIALVILLSITLNPWVTRRGD